MYQETTFGQNLNQIRLERKLSTADFAALLRIDERTIKEYLNGPKLPGLFRFQRICDKLELTPNDLLGYSG